MGKIKGWTKRKDGVYLLDKNPSIQVIFDKQYSFERGKNQEKWVTEITSRFQKLRYIYAVKSSAKKRALKYMRSHSNG